ncbi:hypothetical protein [Nocardia rhizosphaerihabitans]|uniref:hypothetical protein n=1 Tax=Nocardia rhizosphaerihabitans TaxID=1691570 RepID=UPI00166B51BC|nr:hypothetical protein [Nocardia rhizosphaerihabitans]
MPTFGDGVDAVSAFAGAAIAGIALFVPFTSRSSSVIDTPYQMASWANSIPRATTLGLIVAVVVAVLIRPGLDWLVAACATAALGLNYFVGHAMDSAEVLTTQNYVNALFGGVIFGALCLCSLQMRWAAAGFALGSVAVFVYGQVIALVTENTLTTTDRAVHSPSGLIIAAVVLLAVNSVRHRHTIKPPAVPQLTADLPMVPIVSATILALSVLLATEWLQREFSGGHRGFWPIALAVAVTVFAAFVAATLLPGRDGAAVLVAVSLAAAGDSVIDGPSLGWKIVLVLGAAAAGILAGLRWASPLAVLCGTGALCVFVTFSERLPWTFVWMVGTLVLAVVAGYAFGSIRVSYGPSAVLGLGAVYLPSILWSIPTGLRNWPTGAEPVSEATAGRAALAITIGGAAALLLLYRIRSAEPTPAVTP